MPTQGVRWRTEPGPSFEVVLFARVAPATYLGSAA